MVEVVMAKKPIIDSFMMFDFDVCFKCKCTILFSDSEQMI